MIAAPSPSKIFGAVTFALFVVAVMLASVLAAASYAGIVRW